MNHFEKLHNYINENYTNLPYDLNYYAERGSKVDMPIYSSSNSLEWLAKLIFNWSWHLMSPKQRSETLSKFKNLEDQVNHDRFIDKVIESINKKLDKLLEKEKYRNAKVLTDKWINKEFRLKDKKSYWSAIKGTKAFYSYAERLQKADKTVLKEFIKITKIENANEKDAKIIIEFILDYCNIIYETIINNYDYYDSDSQKSF